MNLQENISRIKQMMGLLIEDDQPISDMVKKDQEMRQQDNFDTKVDLINQKQLKHLIGQNPQRFIENLTNPEEIEGVWLIAQHADNDSEFQKMILELLISNEKNLSDKFNIPIQRIKQGIAMLTDRVMVNSSTSIKGFRDGNNQDFSKISSGTQKYGTQGGSHNGNWIPRPIKMGGEVYFFKTPEELYNNKEFLTNINKLRHNVGLIPLEDYVQNMQQYS